MMVLVTGGLGLVGRWVVRDLLLMGHSVRLFDTPRAGRLQRLLHRLPTPIRRQLRRMVVAAVRNSGQHRADPADLKLEIVRGDLCNIADVGGAVRDVDAVVHLGAIIPPAADRFPVRADYVNRGGTENIITALERQAPDAKLIYASSIAVYGDRRAEPNIGLDDEPNPHEGDHYAIQKLAAEKAIRNSHLEWTIFRLTGIASPDKLKLDPLMYDMPLETNVEWCTAEDVATALANSVECQELSGRVLHLAGGDQCRSTFREFLDGNMQAMGLGEDFFPPQAFGPGPFHCGYMDTTLVQELLKFQNHSLQDYFGAVARRVRWRRPLVRMFRGPIRSFLLSKSPYWAEYESRLSAKSRRRVRFGWLIGGMRGHQVV
jgi:nucleoside-diphosphate-sugar epimerase